jgi:hypothetical protein
MKISVHTAFTAATPLFFSCQVFGYETVNHMDMSESALLQISSLSTDQLISPQGATGKLFRLGLKQQNLRAVDPAEQAKFQRFPKAGQYTNECARVDVNKDDLTILQLIRFGSCYEDLAEVGAFRSLAHFYNPQDGGSGTAVGLSSPNWSLARNGLNPLTGANHFTWPDARDAFYDALTFRVSGIPAEILDEQRRAAWGTTFQSLGHIIHHLQDMAQPQHVRGDTHCDSALCTKYGAFNPSYYEKYMQWRPDLIQVLAATATTPIMFGLPREFWSMQGDSITGYFPPNQGIAAYTSTNFVSAGTDYRMQRSGGISTPRPASDILKYPIPTPSYTEETSVGQLLSVTNATASVQLREGICKGDVSTCKIRFYGSTSPGQENTRKSSVSLFHQEMLGASGTTSSGAPGLFSQNNWTYVAAATDLIPKAVEYSAGLINYFFRGEMEVSLPDEGVYAILDHAVTNAKGSGFNFIKLKVKNTTADITTAPTATRPTGISKQDMSAGQFFAVAKFHRNTCYTADLRGQIGTVGRGATAIVNPWSCRSPVEEIVVSAAEPSITSLAAGDPAVTMAFDFPNPIPIEATDLFIQIVFKGTLGEEQDAVAVTTKNLSEPSFLTHLDASDVIACGTEEGNICRPIDDTSATVYFKACASNATLCDVTVPQRSKFGFNRWLGFKPETPSTKVIEWHAARTDLPDAPTYQVDRGTYRRVALLADVETPNRTISWGSSTQTVTIAVDKGDLPLSFGLFNSTGQFFPTAEALIPAVSRLAATQLKETVGGTAPSVLPQYSVIRGVVMGVNKPRPSAPDALPGLIYSSGENVKTASYYDAVKHPDNSTVFEQGPVLPTDALKAVGSLKFSRSTPFGLPALTTQELAQLAGDADGYRLNRQPRLVRTQDATAYYAWTEQ